MKRAFKYIRLKQGTPEWKQFRRDNGIGGSEVASVLATTSPELADLVYQPPLKLFLEKIDEPVLQFQGNIASEEGKWQEPEILRRFCYYDLNNPDQMNLYKNEQLGLKKNRIIRPGNIIVNPKYPFLFYSMDAFLMESLVSRVPCAVLECKATTSMESKKFANGVNPAHFIQCQTGLMVTGFEIGYILTLTDGKWFSVTPVKPDPEIHKWIEQTCAEFWTRVLRARVIKMQHNIDSYFGQNTDRMTPEQQQGVEQLMELEPQLVGSTHELDFIKEMILPVAEESPRQGDDEEWNAVQQYVSASALEKAAQADKQKAYGVMLKNLNGYNRIEFGEGERFFYTYKADINGKARLYVSPKIKV